MTAKLGHRSRCGAHWVAMKSPTERRRTRSSDPLVALHYQLAFSRREGGLDAVVVADDSGVVVAASGGWAACEELAAYAPLLVRGHHGGPGSTSTGRLAEIGLHADVQAIDVDGQTVLLCARGERAKTAAMRQVADGVARILSRAA